MPGALKDHWDEFDWERELRKDDARVAIYMDELPRYIDLPAEDAVIMKHIEEKPGLVPADGDYSGTFLDNMFEPDLEEGEVDFTEDWQRRDGASVFIAASRLARIWAQFGAWTDEPEAVRANLRILCLYGKIMARSGDLIDMEEDDYIQLRVALVKRLLSDVNELMGEFTALMKGRAPVPSACTEFHFESLMSLREELLDLLKKYRSQAK